VSAAPDHDEDERTSEVVDAHVHLLPGRLAAKIRAYFEHGWSAGQLAYPIDPPTLRARLAAEGIGTIWTLPYVHKPGMATGLNDSIAALAAEPGPVRIVAGATVHPADDDPERIVRHAVEEGGARVLKLHCSVGDHTADDPRLDGVWRWAEAVRLPVVVHVGHRGSGRTVADELDPVEAVARRHPELPLVIAHCAHPSSADALALMDRHPSVHADLTPVVTSPVALPPGALAAYAGRLLFGSDAPNTVIAAGTGLAALRTSGLAPDALAAVTGGTARRLVAAVRT